MNSEHELYTRIRVCIERFYKKTMTQKAIADVLDISEHSVGKWKKGITLPTREMIQRIAQLTETSVEWLLSGETYAGYGELFSLDYKYPYELKQEFWSANALELQVGTTGPCGGDAGHGGATYVRIRDICNTSMGVKVHTNGNDVTIGVQGDAEMNTLGAAMSTAGDFIQKYILSPDNIPVSNAARPREPVNFVLDATGLPVVGKAAADETQGTRAGFFPPDPEAHFEQVTIPETTSAVEILGDSMSPVLLHGQYALLGPEYVGLYEQPKNYDIVVADIEVRDDEQAGSDTHWEGVYCKRIVDAGGVWVFLSINHTGTPFSAAKANCRIWPVIGVWFAGKGKPPEE